MPSGNSRSEGGGGWDSVDRAAFQTEGTAGPEACRPEAERGTGPEKRKDGSASEVPLTQLWEKQTMCTVTPCFSEDSSLWHQRRH